MIGERLIQEREEQRGETSYIGAVVLISVAAHDIACVCAGLRTHGVNACVPALRVVDATRKKGEGCGVSGVISPLLSSALSSY